MVWNLFPFKGDFSFRKSQKSQGTKFGLRGRGWVTWVIWCFTKKLCMRYNAWVGMLSWWSDQLPVAHSCGLLSHPNTFRGRIFKLNAKFEADFFFYSLSNLKCHIVHRFTQERLQSPLTSTVKLSLFTHMHFSPLSWATRLHWCCTNHYINNGWTFSGQTSYPYDFWSCHASVLCQLFFSPGMHLSLLDLLQSFRVDLYLIFPYSAQLVVPTSHFVLCLYFVFWL